MNKFIANSRIMLNLFIPQRRKPDRRHAIPEADRNLSEETIVFTGGTDGMGRVAAQRLYRMGANVILLGRNEAKGEETVRDMTSVKGSGELSFQICNLASMDSVKCCAERILAEHSKIDILVNCAGLTIFNDLNLTEDGFEVSWAVNYLGPYLLTRLLLERIQASAPSRIVNLTTNFDFVELSDLENIKTDHHFDTANSYGDAKLWMNMFTVDIAHKLESTGISANYLYPGYISSNLLRNLKGAAGAMRFFMRVMASPAEVGADRIVRLAVSSEYNDITGQYVSMDQKRLHPSNTKVTAKREELIKKSDTALSDWL